MPDLSPVPGITSSKVEGIGSVDDKFGQSMSGNSVQPLTEKRAKAVPEDSSQQYSSIRQNRTTNELAAMRIEAGMIVEDESRRNDPRRSSVAVDTTYTAIEESANAVPQVAHRGDPDLLESCGKVSHTDNSVATDANETVKSNQGPKFTIF